MKILIFENNEKNISDLNALFKTISLDISSDHALDDKQLFKLYKKNPYQMVFINCNNDVGINIKNKIRQLNPDQKVVIVNNSFRCSDSKGCTHCKNNSNTIRIFEPYRITEVVKAFKNQKCDHDYCQKDLHTKLLIISKKYTDIVYNQHNKTFSVAHGNKDLLTHLSIIDLSQQLHNNNINFSIENNVLKIGS